MNFKLLKSKKGTSLMMFLMIIMFFILGAVIVIDVSALAIERAHLSASVDAATLAASQTLFDEYIVNGTNNAGGVVEQTVKDYFINNNQDLTELEDNEAESFPESDYMPENPEIIINKGTSLSIEVIAKKKSPLYFAKLFHLNEQYITCNAKVLINTLGRVSGLRPFALSKDEYDRIKEDQDGKVLIDAGGGNNPYPGNFLNLDLDGLSSNGTPDLNKWIIEGYDGYLGVDNRSTEEIEDKILVESGNAASVIKTIKKLIESNGGEVIILVPIIDFNYYIENHDWKNSSDPLGIYGFASVKLTFDSIQGNSGQANVMATFVETIAAGDADSSASENFGAYVTKMVE